MTKSDALKPRRQLGLFDATMIVMGGIVGAGIFANPSEVAHRVHTPFLILGVWILGGLIAMCGAFIWAELATRLPAAAGGQYVYLREAYHPAVAFMYGAIARDRRDVGPPGGWEELMRQLCIPPESVPFALVTAAYEDLTIEYLPYLLDGVEEAIQRLARKYQRGLICNTGYTGGRVL